MFPFNLYHYFEEITDPALVYSIVGVVVSFVLVLVCADYNKDTDSKTIARICLVVLAIGAFAVIAPILFLTLFTIFVVVAAIWLLILLLKRACLPWELIGSALLAMLLIVLYVGSKILQGIITLLELFGFSYEKFRTGLIHAVLDCMPDAYVAESARQFTKSRRWISGQSTITINHGTPVKIFVYWLVSLLQHDEQMLLIATDHSDDRTKRVGID